MDQNTFRLPPADLLAFLRQTPFFKHVDEPTLRALAPTFDHVSFAAGDYLFRQGDAGDSGMYIIIDGHLSVTVTQENGEQLVIDEKHTGQIFGEMGLLNGSARTASVKAKSNTTLVRISKVAFDDLVQKNPQILSQIGEIILHHLHRMQLISLLINLFGSLDLAVIDAIEAELIWVHLSRGQVLMRQGEQDNNIYLLVSGRLRAFITDEVGQEQVVGEIVEGESVGEMQIFTGETRSVSVYSVRDSVLVKLSKESFDLLSDKYPQILKHVTRQIINRLRRTVHAAPVNRLKAAFDIVLIPAGPDVPLADFAHSLTKHLEKFGSTLFLNKDRFDSYLGKPGTSELEEEDPNNIRLVAWLNEQEAHYDFLIYETDYTPTPWTKRCLRQADQVLIVGNANGDPTPGAIEAELLQVMHQQQNFWQALVLLQPKDIETPTNTHKWLSGRKVDKHYHIRWGDEAHMRRLARLITGRGIGLVLGGGGARGFAHLGVIRAINELGFEVDRVGGTSFGALAGAVYALEQDYDTMYEKVKQLTKTKLIYDYTIPFTAFLAGRKYNRILQQHLFGELNIEDTWRPFYCVSTDFRSTEQVVHQQGPIWKYIRASSAMPIVFPPVVEGDMILMDGGVVNNDPVDVMRHLSGDGPVIAVNVTIYRLKADYPPITSVSGWEVLWSRLNPFIATIKPPPLSSLVMRWWVMTNTRNRLSQAGMADLYINPAIAGYDILEFDAYDEIIEAGYQAGLEQMKAWLVTKPIP